MIADESALAALVRKIEEAPWVALDTEADSLHAYPEKLCLMQISLPGSDDLIDPLAGLDLTSFWNALAGRELVFHAADYDLRLIYRTYRFVPGRIFDTMWAARLLGIQEYAYHHLVEKFLGVKLEKGPQKMDWAQRPLTPRMEAYARNDTRFLQPLSEILRAKLMEKGRLAWMEEISARVIGEAAQIKVRQADQVWRLRGSDRLNEFGLAILKEIWLWREEEALAANKPPYFILSHERAVDLALELSQRKRLPNQLPKGVRGERANRLREVLTRALEIPPGQYPALRKASGRKLTRIELEKFERLKKQRDFKAAELELDPTIIASKPMLISVSQGNGQPLMEWQRDLLALDLVRE